ncbi:unnamed protein product [Soboliphyme baturini]|uniref:Rhodanese domain-containing protein n=1 Tax=Soboliphyme baturini TaxID=241478 RepID=A0A183J9T6_9BILA|nr:unnamed protein product [Soboliphyme baturini]
MTKAVACIRKGWLHVRNSSYMLLDVRVPQQFQKCHVTGAVNYPYTVASIGRAAEPRELIAFKHQPTKPIICYDFDGHHAPDVARTLLQRGYRNFHVLNGGNYSHI